MYKRAELVVDKDTGLEIEVACRDCGHSILISQAYETEDALGYVCRDCLAKY